MASNRSTFSITLCRTCTQHGVGRFPAELQSAMPYIIAQRYKRTAYPVWDAAVARERGLLRPYLRLQNLSDTGYQEIAGVTMPGRSIVGGISIWLGR